MLIFVAVGLLSFFGKVDDVIKVSGIVRTKENVSCVRNVISGRITEICYRPGQHVSQGEVLYRLDGAVYDAQRETLASEREKEEERRLGIEEIFKSFESGKNLVSESNTVAFLRYESFLKNKEKLIVQKNISYEALENERSLPASLRNKKTLTEKELDYDYNVKNLKSYETDFLRSLAQEKDELTLSLYKLSQEISRLDSQYEFLSIVSPVDGFVQEVSSLNIGDYVDSGSVVMNIVPDDSANFRVEMRIRPRDMGKIQSGLKVKYRLSAFPFFEYKGAEGTIQSIDPDIRSGSSGQLYYVVYADIDRTSFENRHGEKFPIRAGLETDARIVLKNDTLLFYVLRKIDFMS